MFCQIQILSQWLLLWSMFVFSAVRLQVQAQLLSPQKLKKVKAFVSLEKALQTPDKVIKLDLWSAHLQEFPNEIFQFKNLQALNLNFNQIRSLPSEIYQLKYLQELRLGHNQLTTYPKGLEKLSFLRVLDLHGNQLKQIPASVGQLKKLEELYLHENQLAIIHANWVNLRQLGFINLSENQLHYLPVTAKHRLQRLKMLILVQNKLGKENKEQLKKCLAQVEIRF